MFRLFSSLVIILSVSCDKFCNPDFQNVLFDSVFNYNETAYILRKPDSIYIMNFDSKLEYWKQIGTEIKFKDMFVGLDAESFDSGFSIAGYEVCQTSEDECRNVNRNFNPTNVTFLFNGRNFLLYRRINETKFMDIKSDDRMVPWNANKVSEQVIANIWKNSDQISRIDGIVLMPEHDTVAILSVSNAYEYEIIDQNTSYFLSSDLTDSPAKSVKGKGGIYHKKEVLFFVNNDVFVYKSGAGIYSKNVSWWDFFSCSYKPTEPTTTTTQITNQTTITSEVSQTETSTEISVTNQTEGKNDSDVSISDSTTDDPITNESNEEDFTEPTLPTNRPTNKVENKNFRTLVRRFSLLLLALIAITAIIVTILAIYGYNRLSKELTKRKNLK